MSAILDHVLAANAAYADSFGEKSGLALPPARAVRHPHLHGCPARPGQIRRPERR